MNDVDKNLFHDYRYYCKIFYPHGLSILDGDHYYFALNIFFFEEMSDEDIQHKIPTAIINYSKDKGFYLSQGTLTQDIHSFILFLNKNSDTRMGELASMSHSISQMNPILKNFLLYSIANDTTTRIHGFIQVTRIQMTISPFHFLNLRLDARNAAYFFENKIKSNEWKDTILKELFPFRYIEEMILSDKQVKLSLNSWLEQNLLTDEH